MKTKSLLLKKEGGFLVFASALFLLTRMVRVLDFPLFCDEAFYLSLAEKIKNDPKNFLLPLATATQPLFVWLVVIFHLVINNLIFAGRLASVFSGFLNLIFFYYLLKRLGFKKESYLTILFFTFSPFALIYHRLAMLESLSLLAMTLGIYGAVCLMQSVNLANSLLFGVLISLGILTKATAFFVYPLSLLVLVFFLLEKKKDRKKLVGYFIFGWLVSFLIYFSLSFLGAGSLRQIGLYNFSMPSGHLAKEAFLNLARIKSNFWRGFLWLRQYFTAPFFWLFVISSIFLLVKKSKEALFFIAWFFLIFGFEVLIARTFFPRYLFPLIIPVVVIPAIFLGSFLKSGKASSIVALIFLTPAFVFNYQLIFNPERAPWPGEDRFQFFEDWTSGKGYNEVALFLNEKTKKEKVAVFIEPWDLGVIVFKAYPLFKDKDIILVEEERLHNPIKETPEEIFRKYQQEEKYIIRDCHQTLPQSWPVKLVSEVKKSSRCEIKVYQVINSQLKY